MDCHHWGSGAEVLCPLWVLLDPLGGSGSPGDQDRMGQRQETQPRQAPPHDCLAFIWQTGAYHSHQLNKHTNPRLVRKTPLPELFISCSQALRCPLPTAREGTGGSTWGGGLPAPAGGGGQPPGPGWASAWPVRFGSRPPPSALLASRPSVAGPPWQAVPRCA